MREMLHFMIDMAEGKRLRVIYRFVSGYMRDVVAEEVRREYREHQK